jgi:hypothetical protein
VRDCSPCRIPARAPPRQSQPRSPEFIGPQCVAPPRHVIAFHVKHVSASVRHSHMTDPPRTGPVILSTVGCMLALHGCTWANPTMSNRRGLGRCCRRVPSTPRSVASRAATRRVFTRPRRGPRSTQAIYRSGTPVARLQRHDHIHPPRRVPQPLVFTRRHRMYSPNPVPLHPTSTVHLDEDTAATDIDRVTGRSSSLVQLSPRRVTRRVTTGERGLRTTPLQLESRPCMTPSSQAGCSVT